MRNRIFCEYAASNPLYLHLSLDLLTILATYDKISGDFLYKMNHLGLFLLSGGKIVQVETASAIYGHTCNGGINILFYV